jgi:hypothetical protein
MTERTKGQAMTMPRQAMVKLITENLAEFEQPSHIEALFTVTVEDLIAGGVDPVRVMGSMIRSWSRLVQADIGKPGLIAVLRDVSSAIEQHDACAQRDRPH